MDASSLASAALALAVEDSRNAALQELLLERERLAMSREDVRSYMAARHFTRDLLSQPLRERGSVLPATWQVAYMEVDNDLVEAHSAMLAALRFARNGNPQGAAERLAAELMGVGDPDEEEERGE